ncbi:hypothetical protein Tco_1317452 [Tanacetum coccineum]
MFFILHHNLVTGDPGFDIITSGNVKSAEPSKLITHYRSSQKMTKDHPLDNISKPRLQNGRDRSTAVSKPCKIEIHELNPT